MTNKRRLPRHSDEELVQLPADTTQPQHSCAPADADAFASQIATAWQKAVASIINTGKLVIEAKTVLPHGQFQKMIKEKLPFGQRTAEMLMAIAVNPVLSNPKFVSQLPPSWGSLYALTQLEDHPNAPENFFLEQLIKDGLINCEMRRSDVTKLFQMVGKTGAGIAENSIHKKVREYQTFVSFRVRDAINDLFGAMRQWPDPSCLFVGHVDDDLLRLSRWLADMHAARSRVEDVAQEGDE
jgi:hypothetical protein